MDWAVRTAITAVDKFTAVMHKMGAATGKFGNDAGAAFQKAEKHASLFKSIFGGVLAGNLVSSAIQRIGHEISQLPKMIEDFASNTMMIGRTAVQLGMTADAFQRLSYAAKLTDTPVEALETAFKKLNMGMGQLRVGAGPLHQLMMRINPALAAQLRTVKSSKDAFLLVADAMSRTKNAQTRAALAQAAFGKSGQEMIPMLLEGRIGIEKLMKEASIYGTVLDDKAIAASERLEDTMKRLRGSVKSVKDQVLGFIVQAITPYLEKATVWIAAHKDLIATKIENFIGRAAKAMQDARPVVEFLVRTIGWLIRNWPLLLAVYIGWTAAQIALDAALDANPIGAIVLALEAMIAAVIIVIHYWKQITSALQAAWNWFNRLFNNPWIKIALMFIAQPLLVIVGAIQTLVDLLSGKGWKSFANMLGPWKSLTDALGVTQRGGQWNSPEPEPPNASEMKSQGARWNGHIWVHAEAGTSARVQGPPRGAPYVMGYAGVNP